MLYGKENRDEAEYLEPIFGSESEQVDLPKYKLNQASIEPRIAYQLVQDEMLDEGNARLNLATFCQTYMEPEAVKLMSQTLEKNAIDKSEYPRTTEIENRCVNMIADLWNASENEKFMGTSTIGSSEACMLGGMAMKFAWRKRAEKLGLDLNAKKPNLVISSGYQVCWEKFCVYWDIEMREVPLDQEHMSINLNKVMDYIDEYTIGIVGIMGITYTGRYDDIKGLNDLVEEYNKYGLVYRGVGWVLWRDQQYLPKELIFKVSYLGGELPTMAINFSHSAAQLIGQYYNFVRYGFDGYKAIHERTHKVALYLAKAIEETGLFEIVNDGSQLPIVCYKLKEDPTREWTLYDLADRLLMKGWQVPAYPLPQNLEKEIIQRLVIRADFGMNMACDYVQDMQEAIDALNQAHVVYHKKAEIKTYGFTH